MPDHVHLLVEVDPQYGVHRLIREIKGRSSHTLRKEFPSLATRLPTLWTNSYFASTVGGSPLAIVKQYIENQKRIKALSFFGDGNLSLLPRAVQDRLAFAAREVDLDRLPDIALAPRRSDLEAEGCR